MFVFYNTLDTTRQTKLFLAVKVFAILPPAKLVQTQTDSNCHDIASVTAVNM